MTDIKRHAGGRPPLPPSQARTKIIRFRIDPDLLPLLEEYEREIDDGTRTETMNLALRQFLHIEDLPEEEWDRVQALLPVGRGRGDAIHRDY